MDTIRMSFLTAAFLAAAGLVHAQGTTPSDAQKPSPQGPTETIQSQRVPGSTATQGVEGGTGTQAGKNPAEAGSSPASQMDREQKDRSSTTQGVEGGTGTQAGQQPKQPDASPGAVTQPGSTKMDPK